MSRVTIFLLVLLTFSLFSCSKYNRAVKLLHKGDVYKAIDVLNKIPPQNEEYQDAMSLSDSIYYSLGVKAYKYKRSPFLYWSDVTYTNEKISQLMDNNILKIFNENFNQEKYYDSTILIKAIDFRKSFISEKSSIRESSKLIIEKAILERYTTRDKNFRQKIAFLSELGSSENIVLPYVKTYSSLKLNEIENNFYRFATDPFIDTSFVTRRMEKDIAIITQLIADLLFAKSTIGVDSAKGFIREYDSTYKSICGNAIALYKRKTKSTLREVKGTWKETFRNNVPNVVDINNKTIYTFNKNGSVKYNKSTYMKFNQNRYPMETNTTLYGTWEITNSYGGSYSPWIRIIWTSQKSYMYDKGKRWDNNKSVMKDEETLSLKELKSKFKKI